LAVLPVALLLALGAGAQAADQPGGTEQLWQISSAGDGSRYRSVGSPFWRIAPDQGSVPAGSEVMIAGGGGALELDAGAMTAQTDAMVQLPYADEGRLIRQLQGRIRYRVDGSRGERFDVLTPYLSLLVRGTVFDVQVDRQGAVVEVIEGVVKVWSSDGASEVRLEAGQSAQVLAGAPGRLQFRGSADGNFTTVAGSYRSDGDDARPAGRGSLGRSGERGDGQGENGGGGRSDGAAADDGAAGGVGAGGAAGGGPGKDGPAGRGAAAGGGNGPAGGDGPGGGPGADRGPAGRADGPGSNGAARDGPAAGSDVGDAARGVAAAARGERSIGDAARGVSDAVGNAVSNALGGGGRGRD
jgi:hypothetical protein